MLVPGPNFQGVAGRRKRPKLRSECDSLRGGSDICHAAKKSSKHHKSHLPVPETDTGGGVENTKGRELTLSKELGKITP